MASAQVSPSTPPWMPMNRSSRLSLDLSATASGVALDSWSTAASGNTHLFMEPAKLMNSTIRPTRAGLAKFMPMPPNSCLTMTMATRSPMMSWPMGMPTGTFMARMMPVTTADRSLMGLGFLSSLQYSHSKATQATTDTAVTSSARMPKMMAEATTQGHRATITLAIRLWVVSSLRTCGEAETISFVSITYCLLF